VIRARLVQRQPDPAGDGAFGAPRGDRTHNGIDYACLPGTIILSPIYGQVTKLGYPYADALMYRYVEITDTFGLRHRVFYIDPLVDLNRRVSTGDEIGAVQDIAAKYPGQGMTNHCHYEVKRGDTYLDPT